MTTTDDARFRYIDLFAGIGGFAAALEAFGGECVYSVEIDPWAASIYERNWGHSPLGDITKDADRGVMNVPAHDVLAAGFPCQPFSKSGAQRGMDETRGTLFFNILTIIREHHPTVVLLENVRNLAGPRHKHEWDIIIRCLREEGYRVSDTPTVFSPHLLPLERGGRPQVRERVFITATYDPDALLDSNAAPAIENISVREGEEWSLYTDLPLDIEHEASETELTRDEVGWIEAWDAFVQLMWPLVRRREGDQGKLPGFPLWVDHWVHLDDLIVQEGTPAWKENFLRKNSAFYTAYQDVLDGWMDTFDVRNFPPSRRKFEWQAQQAMTLWECAMQMRPSGIRAKRLTHLPALVAITQTSIIGPLKRRLSWREAARLQGFTDNFDFGNQAPSRTFKQLGNGVSVGAVWNVIRAHSERDELILKATPIGESIYNATVRDAPKDPTDRVQMAIDRGQERYAAKFQAPTVRDCGEVQ